MKDFLTSKLITDVEAETNLWNFMLTTSVLPLWMRKILSDTTPNSPYKFVLNFWVEELKTEYNRVKSLKIGKVTDILEAYPTCHYFHLTDPDNNVIEITGGYHVNENICRSCGMNMKESDYGTNADWSLNQEYCKYCFSNGEFKKIGSWRKVLKAVFLFLSKTEIVILLTN